MVIWTSSQKMPPPGIEPESSDWKCARKNRLFWRALMAQRSRSQPLVALSWGFGCIRAGGTSEALERSIVTRYC